MLASTLSYYLLIAMFLFTENGLSLENIVMSHSYWRRYEGSFFCKNIPEKFLVIYLKFLSDNCIAKSSGRTQKIEGRQKRFEIGLSIFFSMKMAIFAK